MSCYPAGCNLRHELEWHLRIPSSDSTNMLESPPLQEDGTRDPSSPKVGSPQERPEPAKKTFPRGAVVLDKNGKPWVARYRIAIRWTPADIWDSDVVHVPASEIGLKKAHIQLCRQINLGLHRRQPPQHQYYVSREHGYYDILFLGIF